MVSCIMYKHTPERKPCIDFQSGDTWKGCYAPLTNLYAALSLEVGCGITPN